MHPINRHPRRPESAWVVTLACLVVFAGCLPASVRPTPTPAPTPVPAPAASAAPSPTPAPPTPTPEPTFLLHTVARGETLVGIARSYGTSGRSIAYWNRTTYPSLDPESAEYRPNLLQAGWVLQIRPGEEYVPPPDDGESGEEVTPEPDEDEGFEPESPSPEASAGG